MAYVVVFAVVCGTVAGAHLVVFALLREARRLRQDEQALAHLRAIASQPPTPQQRAARTRRSRRLRGFSDDDIGRQLAGTGAWR